MSISLGSQNFRLHLRCSVRRVVPNQIHPWAPCPPCGPQDVTASEQISKEILCDMFWLTFWNNTGVGESNHGLITKIDVYSIGLKEGILEFSIWSRFSPPEHFAVNPSWDTSKYHTTVILLPLDIYIYIYIYIQLYVYIYIYMASPSLSPFCWF